MISRREALRRLAAGVASLGIGSRLEAQEPEPASIPLPEVETTYGKSDPIPILPENYEARDVTGFTQDAWWNDGPAFAVIRGEISAPHEMLHQRIRYDEIMLIKGARTTEIWFDVSAEEWTKAGFFTGDVGELRVGDVRVENCTVTDFDPDPKQDLIHVEMRSGSKPRIVLG